VPLLREKYRVTSANTNPVFNYTSNDKRAVLSGHSIGKLVRVFYCALFRVRENVAKTSNGRWTSNREPRTQRQPQRKPHHHAARCKIYNVTTCLHNPPLAFPRLKYYCDGVCRLRTRNRHGGDVTARNG